MDHQHDDEASLTAVCLATVTPQSVRHWPLLLSFGLRHSYMCLHLTTATFSKWVAYLTHCTHFCYARWQSSSRTCRTNGYIDYITPASQLCVLILEPTHRAPPKLCQSAFMNKQAFRCQACASTARFFSRDCAHRHFTLALLPVNSI